LVTAFVMVNVEPGKEAEICQEVSKHSAVCETALTYGEFDILVKVKVESMDALNDFVFRCLRKIPGIRETTTVIVAEYVL